MTSGLAIGVVLSMHTRATMERFGAEALIPAALAIALLSETGPLMTGLLVAGRVGAGIGAELGGMKVTEQIDALESLAVDSFHYLAVTRVIACMIALPILTTVMNFSGLIGGFSCGDRDFGCFFASLFSSSLPGHRFRGLRSAHGEDHGIRLHHRHGFLLPGLYGDGRFGRRRTSIDAKRCSFIDAPHRRQRFARQDHPAVVSGWGLMSTSCSGYPFRERFEVVRWNGMFWMTCPLTCRGEQPAASWAAAAPARASL